MKSLDHEYIDQEAKPEAESRWAVKRTVSLAATQSDEMKSRGV